MLGGGIKRKGKERREGGKGERKGREKGKGHHLLLTDTTKAKSCTKPVIGAQKHL